MRVTLRLDDSDCAAPCPYAVVWLDRSARKWSREGYVGLDLPESGSLRVEADRAYICGPHDLLPWCVLEGLRLDDPVRTHVGTAGCAHWCGSPNLTPRSGHWTVTRVEKGEWQTHAVAHDSTSPNTSTCDKAHARTGQLGRP